MFPNQSHRNMALGASFQKYASLSRSSKTFPDSDDDDDDEVHSNSFDAPLTFRKWLQLRPAPKISYEVFVSTIFYLLCIVGILDRFYWNIWPRQTFHIGAGSAGTDKMDGLKEGPWSVALYDIVARVSGRYAILAYNFLLFTRMESVEWAFGETNMVSHFIDCRDIVQANLRMHRWNGIALCVTTLVHVWSILFPCLLHGYSAQLVVGNFEWPLSERTPRRCDILNPDPNCWPGDANAVSKTMGLQVDDVFRMVEMTILFVVLLPLSIRWLSSRWHAAIHLHRFIHVIYFVDIVRRHSHPHSWVLNTPMFVAFYLDKWVFAYWHRRNNKPDIEKIKISDDYMLLLWQSPFRSTATIGPHYSLLLHNTSFLEDKHAFTCFENRSGTMLPPGSRRTSFEWDVGTVIRVYRKVRSPKLGELHSHTSRIYDTKDVSNMLITGPRQGEMSQWIRIAFTELRPVVLVGTGSAINFLLDALQWGSQNQAKCTAVTIAFSTRDIWLFEWAFKTISNLLIEFAHSPFKVIIAFTGKKDVHEAVYGSEECEINVVNSRLSFDNVIGSDSVVFCQGSATMKMAVANCCAAIGASFHGGLGGGS